MCAQRLLDSLCKRVLLFAPPELVVLWLSLLALLADGKPVVACNKVGTSGTYYPLVQYIVQLRLITVHVTPILKASSNGQNSHQPPPSPFASSDQAASSHF